VKKFYTRSIVWRFYICSSY